MTKGAERETHTQISCTNYV